VAQLWSAHLEPRRARSAPGSHGCLGFADKTKEQVLADLGIKVIWYEKHEDLPGMLDSLPRVGKLAVASAQANRRCPT
jgi:hypothetical protein